jgi:predicted permease
MITGVLFGLAPAVTALRTGLSGRPGLRGGTRRAGLRPVLVALQIAIAAVLLAGAGLLMRSFHRLHQVDTGFRAEGVLTVRFFLPRASYPAERCVQLYERMIERMKTLPGVETAAAVSAFPFAGVSANVVFDIPGRVFERGEQPTADFRAATPDYFRTVGVPLLAGRGIEADTADSEFVAVVNRAFADRFFAGRDPIGESIRILGPKPRRIVGIIGNTHHRSLEAHKEPEIYVPHTQFPTGGMFLAVRTRLEDPAALASTVRAELRGLDPNLPIAQIQTWTDLLDKTLSYRRFSLTLLTIFGVVAVALALIGTYGMLSFDVSQRTREIGIRMASGAAPVEVVCDAVSSGMRPVVFGLAAGIAGATGLSRFLEGLLFEVRPYDPATLVAVGVLLLAAASAASLVPARRAARVDPITALRVE